MLLQVQDGEVSVENVVSNHIEDLLAKLELCGCNIKVKKNSIYLKAPERLKAIDIATEPYPGFPTDLQSIYAATMVRADGISNITENIFENRFKYVSELKKMGAIIEECENKIKIKGTEDIFANNLKAMDLRGGAALIIAALQAKGKSRISNIQYILRGYDKIDTKLRNIGADIRIEEGE